MLQKYCACHEKVQPGHANSCNCHAKWPLHSSTSMLENLQPFHRFSVPDLKHRLHKARNPCACHAKSIVSNPLLIHHAYQCSCNLQELTCRPCILQRLTIATFTTPTASSARPSRHTKHAGHGAEPDSLGIWAAHLGHQSRDGPACNQTSRVWATRSIPWPSSLRCRSKPQPLWPTLWTTTSRKWSTSTALKHPRRWSGSMAKSGWTGMSPLMVAHQRSWMVPRKACMSTFQCPGKRLLRVKRVR